MNADEITPIILTYNEECNIQRTIDSLSWAKKIIVVDSFSTDKTLEILEQDERIKLYSKKFESFADQTNFALSQVETPWVFSLDADYALSKQSSIEIENLSAKNSLCGYYANFVYCIQGHPLKSSLLPPRLVLYKKKQAHYFNDGHAHRVFVKGEKGNLSFSIFHDDRKPLKRWIDSQQKYAALEVGKLIAKQSSQLSFPDKIRKLYFLSPVLVFFYALFFKGLWRDGWYGLYYVIERVFAELILTLHLLHRRLSNK